MKLGFLGWVPENAKFPFTKWATIAAEAGIEFEYIRTRPSNFTGSDIERRNFVDKASQLLEEADAFIVPYSTNYADLTRVHERVRQGARLVYIYQFSDEESFRSSEAFLAHYDMAPTRKSILQGLSSDSHLITLKREDGSLLDPRLFRGVSEVVIEHPYLLWYSDDAFPVLIATDEHWVLDQEKDEPDDPRRYLKNAQHIPEELLKKWSLPEGWNVRDLVCMAVWYNEKNGAVLGVAGDLFSDPVVIGRNRRLPGIEANEQLARNILDFLCESKGSEKTAVGPEELCDQIEVNLGDFVIERLKAALADKWWTDGVPQKIRIKCAGRKEEEGKGCPKECYLDLIDLKPIMEKQWKYFEPAFRAVGVEGGKKKCLAWMDKLNEIRRMCAHPLKRVRSGHVFSREDREFLWQWHACVLKLKKSRV